MMSLCVDGAVGLVAHISSCSPLLDVVFVRINIHRQHPAVKPRNFSTVPQKSKKHRPAKINMEAAKQKVEALVGQVAEALQLHSNALTDSLKQGGLVPGPATADGLIPEGFKPETQLDISFDGQKVELGNFFRASQCKVAPTVSFQREVRMLWPIAVHEHKS